MKVYEVGGCVRDEILGVPSKDIDFTVVLETADRSLALKSYMPADPFDYMVKTLENWGFKIFLKTPQYLTVRAQFPKNQESWDRRMSITKSARFTGLTADFVLARQEGDYEDGRRPTDVMPGTLEDDLARRDFTMNAIAKRPDGTYVDPFFGQVDIRARKIRAVGDPHDRLREDALRAVRALRFSVTKGFSIEKYLAYAMESSEVLNSIVDNISDERIAVELSKMFRYNSVDSILQCNKFPALTAAMFSGNVSLDSTMKLKGRG